MNELQHVCLKHSFCRQSFASHAELTSHMKHCKKRTATTAHEVPGERDVRDGRDDVSDAHLLVENYGDEDCETPQACEDCTTGPDDANLKEFQDYSWVEDHDQTWNRNHFLNLQEKLFASLYGTEALTAVSFEEFTKKSKPQSCGFDRAKNFEFYALLQSMNLTENQSRSLLKFIHGLFNSHCKCGEEISCKLDKSYTKIVNASKKQYDFMRPKSVDLAWPKAWKMNEYKHEVRDLIIPYICPLEQLALKLVDPYIMFENSEEVMLEAEEMYNDEGKRVVSSCMTGDWAIKTQELMRRNLKKVPEERRLPESELILVPVIDYADGVTVGNRKHVTQNSALCTIGNFSIPFSKRTISKFSTGYIPDLKDYLNIPQLVEHLRTECGYNKTFIKDDIKYFQLQIERAYYTPITFLISKCWLEGVPMYVLGQGRVKEIHTVYAHQVGDMPAQRKHNTIKANSCNCCQWIADKQEVYNPQVHLNRNFDQIVELTTHATSIRDSQRAMVRLSGAQNEILKLLDGLGVYPIFNVHNAVASGMILNVLLTYVDINLLIMCLY